MKNRKIYITNKEWFESGSLRNPIVSLDHNLEKLFPDFYCLDYDTKLLVTNPPSSFEKESSIYNDYREEYGTSDIQALDIAIKQSCAKNIFLNGFDQKHFDYIAPFIKDTAEVICFFKCPKIKDLSVLSQFQNLKCVHIYHNNSLTNLWDMTNNIQLKVLSFTMVSKLINIGSLKDSHVEYIHLDSMDNSGNKKPALFDTQTFEQMPKLQFLSLNFSNCKIEKTR